jgi:hypothetical protein
MERWASRHVPERKLVHIDHLLAQKTFELDSVPKNFPTGIGEGYLAGQIEGADCR